MKRFHSIKDTFLEFCQGNRLLGWGVFLLAGFLYIYFGTPGGTLLSISLVVRSVFLIFAIWLFAYTHYKGAQKRIVSGVSVREASIEEKTTPWGETYETVYHPEETERYRYVTKDGRKMQTLLCIIAVIDIWAEWADAGALDHFVNENTPGIIAAIAFVAGFMGMPKRG